MTILPKWLADRIGSLAQKRPGPPITITIDGPGTMSVEALRKMLAENPTTLTRALRHVRRGAL